MTISTSPPDDVGVMKVELYASGTKTHTGAASLYSYVRNTSKQAGAVTQLQAKAYDARDRFGVSTTVQVITR